MLRKRTKLLESIPWEGEHGPRILVEHPDGAEAWALAEILTRSGFDVRACPGPGSCGRAETVCPLLVGERCALVQGADAVVSSSRVANSEAIVRALGAARPELPVFVEVPRPRSERYLELEELGRILPFPARPDEVVARLRGAVGLAVPAESSAAGGR
jgi:hypothetical protein